jgi:cation diffusion facilitator CzcD-associated flavoprotein CzcO
MLTFGYSFFPWTRPEILAKAPLILDYLRAVVDKFGLSRYIQYGSAVQKADWSSENGRWAVTVSSGSDSAAKTEGRGAAAAPRVIRAKYLFMCGGYYQYDKGNTPNFEGRDVFEKNGGEVIHPQAWEGRDGGKVDVVGKRVAVIGSGATAVTLVPELVKEGAAHVTCVQRSPTYLMSVTPKDYFVAFLRFICVSAVLASRMGRYVQIKVQNLWFHFCTNFPGIARFILQCVVKLFLGFNTDMTHWTPKYDPWKQRLCAVVNGDFFLAIRRGGASMATGHIDRFTAQGIKLKGGQEVKADVIVTATGMNMQRVSRFQ